ncbi:hypothetical protein ACWIHQ_25760, partial [Streptomyces anulatus]
MNTFLNYLVVAALFALVLAPVALGLARERRIDRQLREAEQGRRAAGPPETRSAAQLLKEKEQSLYEELQSAQMKLNQAKSRASASELTLQEAKGRLEKAKAAWLEHTKNT